ncbi:MAG: hypothetical protein LKG14_05050 [Prevotella sp.]|jgi:hypothetical protein|uniref:Uncharacterized protein n=1 Tax=Segatella cerevisiae TaxID=2053716 RepID=A0ABT1BX15_9BACT|nr:hypothetical protein [Segatella cerevisiae]MCH3994770.1 hypothetical protein [Prevotella sp.]MCI1246739.1 hypothetical protein [Prevotella sp.]MCO6024798.1 hypothetical protein [Segatella cerevisiae]
MSIQLAFILFVVVALVGWGVCELKSRSTFTHSEAEKKELEEMELADKAKGGYHEMNLHELIQNNSSKGYDAVDNKDAVD